jgi:hypothetical protein
MEGPTVKAILWRVWSARFERISEGDSPRRKMGRLRRRIRLIYADCRGQSRMTVVRRELPPSRSASRPAWCRRHRIASARALQSCPHHAGAAAPQKRKSSTRAHHQQPRLESRSEVQRPPLLLPHSVACRRSFPECGLGVRFALPLGMPRPSPEVSQSPRRGPLCGAAGGVAAEPIPTITSCWSLSPPSSTSVTMPSVMPRRRGIARSFPPGSATQTCPASPGGAPEPERGPLP